jgi:hypothetical protein
MMYVPEELRAKASIYEERNKLYGDSYKIFGSIMELIGLDNFNLRSADDHNRFGVYVQLLGKVIRYGKQFDNGGHADSLDDMAVYAMMLKELDHEIETSRAEEPPPHTEVDLTNEVVAIRRMRRMPRKKRR